MVTRTTVVPMSYGREGGYEVRIVSDLKSTASAENQPAQRAGLTRRESLALLSVLSLASVGAGRPYAKPQFVEESEMEAEPGSRIR